MRTATLAFVLVLALVLAACSAPNAPREEAAWQPLFDGKTLTGWSAPDMSWFRVEDGAITGEVTEGNKPARNQFIVWQGGEVADFELTFEFRIFGAASNSGMQFRSTVKEHGLVHGYQADIDGQAKFFGGIWDEYGTRKSLSARGQHSVIAADGSRSATPIAAAAALAGVKVDQWTRYHLKAVGPRIELHINGILATVLEDRESGKAARSGVLAMPVIPAAMKVQYRDLRLKRL
jgi:hypothetical protein